MEVVCSSRGATVTVGWFCRKCGQPLAPVATQQTELPPPPPPPSLPETAIITSVISETDEVLAVSSWPRAPWGELPVDSLTQVSYGKQHNQPQGSLQ